MGRQRRLKWWHGLLFYGGVQAVDWSIRTAVRQARGSSNHLDRSFYERQRRPSFAPPGIAFPIAWSINSASAIAGAIHVVNRETRTPEARTFLQLQAAAWLLFATFNTAYFELRSPINAALVTLAYSGLTAASLDAAARMKDWRAIVSLVPTAMWLALANPVAIGVVALSRDEFWNFGPLLPPQRVGGCDFARGEPGSSPQSATSAKNETNAATTITPQG